MQDITAYELDKFTSKYNIEYLKFEFFKIKIYKKNNFTII